MHRKPLTKKQYLELYSKQNGKCALSGVKFKVGDSIEDDHIIPVASASDGKVPYIDPVKSKEAGKKIIIHIDVNDIRNRQLVLKKAHKKKTKTDTRNIRKGRRTKAKHLGWKSNSSLSNSKYKKLFDGTVVYKDTGEPVGRG